MGMRHSNTVLLLNFPAEEVAVAHIHEYVSLQKSGVLRLPVNVREKLRLDEPGAQVEIEETEDGRFELRGVLPVPADQQWFWTERWQKMEQEADADVLTGRTLTTSSVAEFLDELDA
jgi:bifunctional DNA-binding transcriptional regulator/antitoxin component of YhaV-PrlF toxin-antitoxin module